MKAKKIQEWYKYVTVSAFIALIFVPGVLWFIFGEMITDNTDNNENRTLAAEPVFDIRKVENYPREFEKYYDDHAPFRNIITEIWANLNYRIFRDSTSSSVTIGKTTNSPREAWLFYSNDEDMNDLVDVQGLRVLSKDDYESIYQTIAKNTKDFGDKGTKFYTLVVPNKENIYREYLPDSVEIFDSKSPVDKLMQQISESRLNNVVYLKDAFDEAKAKNEGQLYYKHDTHWNDLGAFYGYQGLMKKIYPDFDTKNYSVSQVGPVINNRDLSKMLNINNYFMDYEEKVKYLDDSKYTETVENYKGAELTTFINKNAPIKKKIFVVGDSFRDALAPYLAKTFSEVRVIHVRDFDTKVYQDFSSDIVLLETVERYATGALELKFFD